MDGDSANRVVNLEDFFYDTNTIGAAMAPINKADQGYTKATGAVMPTSPARAPLQAAGSVVAICIVLVRTGKTDPVAPAKKSVGGIQPDRVTGGDIEPEPAEEQNEGANHNEGEVTAQYLIGGPVCVVFA